MDDGFTIIFSELGLLRRKCFDNAKSLLKFIEEKEFDNDDCYIIKGSLNNLKIKQRIIIE